MQSDIDNLKNIIRYCNNIEDAIDECEGDVEDFLSNTHYSQSCAFSIIQIGESVKRLSPELRNKYKEMPWSEIAKFRDMIAHQYGVIDLYSLWDSITKEFSVFKEDCERILESIQ